jgi:iron complex outermembrane receptor protein
MKIRSTGGFRPVTALGAAGTLTLALMAAPANAQTAADTRPANSAEGSQGTELEEVVVTAERRTADVQKVPASVSVRTGEELTEQGRYTTVEILQDIPGLTAIANNSVNSTNIGSSDMQGNNITIRGINVGGGAGQISGTPATAVYVDGVYEGIGGNYDIERVEVLRGPQGTLYGRSATAGVVAFHTRDPSLGSYGGDAEVEVVNLPLGDTLAVRVAGDYRDQGEGYFNEAGRGMGNTLSGRVKVLWKPGDDFSLLLGGAYERDEADSGGDQSSSTVTHVVSTTFAPTTPGYKLNREAWAELNWDFGPAVLTYQPTYRSWYQNDNKLQTNDFLNSGAPLENKLVTPLDQFHTEELRLASKDTPVGWQVGAFYYRDKLDATNDIYLGAPAPGSPVAFSNTVEEKDTRDLGFYGEMTFSPVSAMRATLGARYDSTRVLTTETFFNNPYAFCGTALQFTVIPILPPGAVCVSPGTASVPPPPGSAPFNAALNFNNFNYKVRLEYDLSPRNMVYGMVSTGFKPGDASIITSPTAPGGYAPNYLASEKLTSYELGSKNRFLDDSLQLNASVYYYDYEGFQTAYTINAYDFNSIPVTVPATNIGGELEAIYQVTTLDRVGLNYSYLESYWKNEPVPFATAYPEKVRALVPNTVTAYYEHLFNLPGGSTLRTRIDGEYISPHRSIDLHYQLLAAGREPFAQMGAETLGNLSATWSAPNKRLSVTAYARNFTNARYITYTYQGNPNSYVVDWNDPRIYGAMVSARF